MKINAVQMFIILSACLIVGLSKNVYTQTETELKPLSVRIDDTKNMLQFKLQLSEEQINRIDTILTESVFGSISRKNKEEKLKSINQKIDRILTARQKLKFNIIKSDWLDDIIKTAQ